MTKTIPHAGEMEMLEALVDKYTLFEMTMALSVIAGDKAEHIAVNWQDAQTAKVWSRASTHLQNAAKKLNGV